MRCPDAQIKRAIEHANQGADGAVRGQGGRRSSRQARYCTALDEIAAARRTFARRSTGHAAMAIAKRGSVNSGAGANSTMDLPTPALLPPRNIKVMRNRT